MMLCFFYFPVAKLLSPYLVLIIFDNLDRRASDKLDWIAMSWILLRRSSASSVMIDLKYAVIGCSIPNYKQTGHIKIVNLKAIILPFCNALSINDLR